MENIQLETIRKYNLWDNPETQFGIPRPSYTDELYRYIGNRMIKVLTGQRRVGKSYLLRQLASKLINAGVSASNILIINKEYSAFDFIATNKDLDELIRLYKRTLNVTDRYFVLIDEVQEIAGWETAINSYSQDYTENVEIFITGSNSKLLSSELATRISGRYVTFNIMPLSFDEYCDFYSMPRDRSGYIRYMQSGGLPALINLHDEEMKRNYVSALCDTIMLKDIVAHYGVKDVRLLSELFAYIVSTASSLVSIPNIVNYLKSKGTNASYLTISSYLNYLSEAYLIHRVERSAIRGKEILSGPCKYYANDLAFNNYLYSNHMTGTGYMLENLVFLELLRAGYHPTVGTLPGKEIDFVAERNGNRLYIQVAYSIDDPHTREREYAPLLEILPAYEKWVVTLDDFAPTPPAGILRIPAWELQKHLRAKT